MIELQYGNLKTSVPGNWEEMNPKQMAKAIGILSSERDRLTAQLAVVHLLLPPAFKKLMTGFSALELLELLKKFEFLITPACFSTFVFKKVKRHWFSPKGFYGPTDSFGNLTVREYGRAEFYLGQYLHNVESDATRAEENLNKFLGCIYFRRKDGERSVPLSTGKFDACVKHNAILLAALPLELKQAIAFNFSAVREFVFSQFDEAFERSEGKSKRDKYGWDGVVQHLSVTRHMVPDAIYHMNLLELLIQLDTVAIANNEREDAK